MFKVKNRQQSIIVISSSSMNCQAWRLIYRDEILIFSDHFDLKIESRRFDTHSFMDQAIIVPQDVIR